MSDKVVCPYYSVEYCKFRDQCHNLGLLKNTSMTIAMTWHVKGLSAIKDTNKFVNMVCKLKLKVYELQYMNTGKANLLKSFTIFVEKEEKGDCENCKEITLIKLDLVQLASKYNKLLAEYTKTKNLLNIA